VQYFDKPEDRSKFRLICDCPYFWSSNSHCAHVVAIYHELGVISIFDMMSDLEPMRKRGRPTTREKALEHDRDLEDDGAKNVKPSAWLKQDIRHPEHLTVMVYDTRTYEKNGQRVTVWNVTFPDAPGGPQDYEMEEEALMEAIKCYAQFKADACKSPRILAKTTVNCQEGSSYPRERRRGLLRMLKLIHPL
jgi:hypothetical protein